MSGWQYHITRKYQQQSTFTHCSCLISLFLEAVRYLFPCVRWCMSTEGDFHACADKLIPAIAQKQPMLRMRLCTPALPHSLPPDKSLATRRQYSSLSHSLSRLRSLSLSLRHPLSFTPTNSRTHSLLEKKQGLCLKEKSENGKNEK